MSISSTEKENPKSESSSIAESLGATNTEVRLAFTGEGLRKIAEMRCAGGYKDLGEVVLSALALKGLVDAAFQEGYSILVMQTPTGKQRRMGYHP